MEFSSFQAIGWVWYCQCLMSHQHIRANDYWYAQTPRPWTRKVVSHSRPKHFPGDTLCVHSMKTNVQSSKTTQIVFSTQYWHPALSHLIFELWEVFPQSLVHIEQLQLYLPGLWNSSEILRIDHRYFMNSERHNIVKKDLKGATLAGLCFVSCYVVLRWLLWTSWSWVRLALMGYKDLWFLVSFRSLNSAD